MIPLRSSLLCVALLLTFLAPAVTGIAATQAELRAEMNAILSRPAVRDNSWSIYVENEWGTTSYYARQPTATMRPASVTKIFTSATAFALLGGGHRFETRVYHTGTFSGGVVEGDLHILPEHDFTWSTRFYSNARAPLNSIALALFNLGVREVNGKIIGGGRGAFADSASNATVAAEFREALLARGITVGGTSDSRNGFNVVGQLLHTHQSIPLDQACIPLNRDSVNLHADFLLRHLGHKLVGDENYAAGETLVRDWLESIGIDSTGLRMIDGSGLLWYNSSNDSRISALQSMELQRYMRRNFPAFEATLARACHRGTLSSRFCDSESYGRVYAKTGTLPNGQTVSLAGYAKNDYDGEVYYFSFIANQATDVTATRQAIDDCVRILLRPGLPNAGQPPEGFVIVDNPEALFAGAWHTNDLMGGHRFNYRWILTESDAPGATATYRPELEVPGLYNIYTWYLPGSNRTTSAMHQIGHRDGVLEFPIDQTRGEEGWTLLAERVALDPGATSFVRIHNRTQDSGKVVIADAIAWELVQADPDPVGAPPLVHYLFNERDGPVPDWGNADPANGIFAGGATRTNPFPDNPGERVFSTSSSRGHLAGGTASKLDRLEQLTLTAWINLRAAPAHANRLVTRQDSDWSGFSWGINRPNAGTISAQNFTMNLFIGGDSIFAGQTATADLGADREWVFIAVTFDASLATGNTAFFTGRLQEPTSLLGERRHIASGRMKTTTADLRVAATGASTLNTAPFAWFDDIRIYDTALTQRQLESIRREWPATAPSQFAQWQRRHFTVEQLQDPGSGPEGDPSGAGIANLLRYALGAAPDTPAASFLPVVSVETATGLPPGFLALAFTRPDRPTDLRFAVEASGDLVSWEETPTKISAWNNGDGTITATYRDTEAISDHDGRFLRLNVSLAGP
jgi:D-alanyl-D-alanine carboxypeptidase